VADWSRVTPGYLLVPTRNTIPLSWNAPDKVVMAVLAASWNSPGARAWSVSRK